MIDLSMTAAEWSAFEDAISGHVYTFNHVVRHINAGCAITPCSEPEGCPVVAIRRVTRDGTIPPGRRESVGCVGESVETKRLWDASGALASGGG